LNAQACSQEDAKRYDWKDRITPSMDGHPEQGYKSLLVAWRSRNIFRYSSCPDNIPLAGLWRGSQDRSVGGKGAKALKLSKTGVKELATFNKKVCEEMGTWSFAHHIEQNPAFQKKVLAAGGVNLRGLGAGSESDPWKRI